MPSLSQQERQSLQAQLDSLQLFQSQPLFQEFLAKNNDLLESATATLLEIVPSGLESFINRERLLGSASELRRISVYFSSMEEDLKAQLNPTNE